MPGAIWWSDLKYLKTPVLQYFLYLKQYYKITWYITFLYVLDTIVMYTSMLVDFSMVYLLDSNMYVNFISLWPWTWFYKIRPSTLSMKVQVFVTLYVSYSWQWYSHVFSSWYCVILVIRWISCNVLLYTVVVNNHSHECVWEVPLEKTDR